MFSLLQILLLAAFVFALASTLQRGKAGTLSRTEALGWSALWVAAGAVVARPEMSSWIAAFFGVGRGADLVVYASVAALFYLVFRIFVRLDKLERDISLVVRKDALEHMRHGGGHVGHGHMGHPKQ